MEATLDYVLPLFVAFPLLGCALAVLAPWKAARDALALLLPAASLAAGAWLYAYTGVHGTIAHGIGGYVGGVAIPFAADRLSAIMIITTALVALTANWFAIAVGETKSRFYPALTLMLLTGVNGALLTADLFNFFVFIEVMLLPSYGLIGMTGTRHRLSGARIFVIVNLTASTLLVVGVSILYGVIGAVNIAALRGAAAGNGPVTVAMGLVVIALVAKAGVFPVHTWLPRTYATGSAAVMGLFSGLHTKVAVYMIFRVFVVIFDMDTRWTVFITVVLVISMLIGAFGGLVENSIRRVIAYQMINGMPFILIPLVFTAGHPELALAAGLCYALHHMITVGSLVLTTGAIEETYGTGQLRQLSGLMRRDPVPAFLFAAAAFSMIGFPPFSGLWGKVLVVGAVAATGDLRAWIVIAAIIVASFGALISLLRVWREVFWGRPMHESHRPTALRIRPATWAPAAVMLAVSVVMFCAAGPLVEAAQSAATQLLDVSAYQHAVLGDNPVAVPNPADFQGGLR